MNPSQRTVARFATLLGLACVATAYASGGYESEDLFFRTARPDQPVREFIQAPAGYYTDHLLPYQVIWYWHFHGQAFSPAAVDAFTTLLTQLPNEDSGMAARPDDGEDWIKARAAAYATLGRPLPSAASAPGSGSPVAWSDERLQDAGSHCQYGDAYRKAAQTLAARLARHGTTAQPAVLHWLQSQDVVFATCGDAPVKAMPPLPSDAPAWLKADRAYQLAARTFYANDLTRADEAFAAIAQDDTSEWRDLAAYMRLRVLARQNPGADAETRALPARAVASEAQDQAELAKRVDAIALPLLKNPRLRPLAPSIHRIAEALRIRLLTPTERIRVLGDQLRTIGDPELAAARLLLLNHEFRSACADGDCGDAVPDKPSDLIAWLCTVRGFTRHGDTALATGATWREQIGWSRFQDTHDLAWLMAAASLVPPTADGRGTRDKAIDAALSAVPAEHPAKFAATQLQAQRLYAQGRFRDARALVANAAESPLVAHSVSGQNFVKALLLPTASSEAEWRRFALRPVVARRDPEAMAPTSSDSASPRTVTAFDLDVIRFLNTRAPIAMWLRLAADPALSPELRDRLLEAAWTRAVLADDHAGARRAAALRIATVSKPAAGADPLAGLRRSMSLADTDDAAWQRLLLERMASASETLAPPAWPTPGYDVIPTPLQPWRPTGGDERALTVGSYSKWCRPLGVVTSGPSAASAAEFALPDYLPEAERIAQTALVGKLKALPSDSIYFTQQSLALMARTPKDPLVPQALSVSVKMAHYACGGAEAGTWSKKGQQVLRASYPNSSWTANTPYWYNGLP